MAIKDLQARQGNVEIVVEIVSVSEPRAFQKFGRSGKVATAKAKDETGEINLSLWNEQVDIVKPGNKVHVTNGYVNEFQGEKQLTTGKFGKLEVVD
jgi:replication factor A1